MAVDITQRTNRIKAGQGALSIQHTDAKGDVVYYFYEIKNQIDNNISDAFYEEDDWRFFDDQSTIINSCVSNFNEQLSQPYFNFGRSTLLSWLPIENNKTTNNFHISARETELLSWREYTNRNSSPVSCFTCYPIEPIECGNLEIFTYRASSFVANSMKALILSRIGKLWQKPLAKYEDYFEELFIELGVECEIDDTVLLHLDQNGILALSIVIEALLEKIRSGLLIEKLKIESFTDDETGKWEGIIFHVFVKLDSKTANREWDELRDLVSAKGDKTDNPNVIALLSDKIGIRFSWIPRKHV